MAESTDGGEGMKVGMIGVGAIGQAIARHVARAGFELALSNRRGPDSLAAFARECGGATRATTIREAAKSDLVFIAVPFPEVKRAVAEVEHWDGRVVVDPTNAIGAGFQPIDLRGRLSTEVVMELVPGAQVVKAFNTLPPGVLNMEPHTDGGRRVIFLSGDDVGANKLVARFIARLGFAAIDLGRLSEGGRLQQFPGGPLPTLNLLQVDA